MAVHPTIPEEESLPIQSDSSRFRGKRAYMVVSARHHAPFRASLPAECQTQRPQQPVPLSQSPSAVRPFPRTSRADGYAYGYGGGGRASQLPLATGE
jgi:hypothetical protein